MRNAYDQRRTEELVLLRRDIERLREKNAKLREALKRIEEHPTLRSYGTVHEAVLIAREALGEGS